ncbi:MULTISPECIES: hypothetical protein [Enterobacter]
MLQLVVYSAALTFVVAL